MHDYLINFCIIFQFKCLKMPWNEMKCFNNCFTIWKFNCVCKFPTSFHFIFSILFRHLHIGHRSWYKFYREIDWNWFYIFTFVCSSFSICSSVSLGILHLRVVMASWLIVDLLLYRFICSKSTWKILIIFFFLEIMFLKALESFWKGLNISEDIFESFKDYHA